jgi:hypothetical protein
VISLKIWTSIKSGVKSLGRALFTKKAVAGTAVVGAVGTVTICDSVSAQSLDLTGVAVDTAPVFSMALIVITGLAAIWAIWKTIGLIRAR